MLSQPDKRNVEAMNPIILAGQAIPSGTHILFFSGSAGCIQSLYGLSRLVNVSQPDKRNVEAMNPIILAGQAIPLLPESPSSSQLNPLFNTSKV
ncbi:hypothetical protein ACFX13_039634 [Malus domestica]